MPVEDEARVEVATRVEDPSRGENDLSEPIPELTFVRPLPGFPDLTRFAIVRPDGDGDDEPVLYELRSLEQPEVGFLVAVPGAFFPEYDIEIDDQTCDDLGFGADDDGSAALVLVVLTIGKGDAETTANLRAPVVINGRTRLAAQVILADTEWPVRATVT